MSAKAKVKDFPLANGPEQIIAAINGFVYVGNVSMDGDGWLRIDNAYNIRRWGTSKGLGQLALEGCQKDTILDPCGVVRMPMHAVIFAMDSRAGLLP